MNAGRLKAFAYVTAEKAALYRAIMSVFLQSRERFAFHLRPQEVLDGVRISNIPDSPDQTEIESALAQLCEWGNLQTHPDTTEVRSVEDFYKQRYVFQITEQGEATERALGLFQQTSEHRGELQVNGLADIRDVLQDLKQLLKDAKPDSRKIYRNLITLQACFEDLTNCAQTFIGSLQRKIDLQLAQADQFTTQTEQLIDYVERFVRELMIAGDDIASTLRDIEVDGLQELLHAAAERSIIDGLESTPENLDAALDRWRCDWERFREWFISRPGLPSHAENLRGRARTSISALLSLITSINDRRISRIDRSNDFRVMARWFLEAPSDADAHRLWRRVFGLYPARHLIINDATLDQHEAQDQSPDTSWLDAPPLRISWPLRAHGSYSRSGRLRPIIDRTAEKEKLAAAAHEEAVRILSAQRRFATGRRMRLSELEELDTGEFDVLLDFLGEAMSANVVSGDTAEIVSADACLRVKLEPTDDGRLARIHTPEGFFSGPDHWISVERISSEEAVK